MTEKGYRVLEKGKKSKHWRSMFPNRFITKKEADRAVTGLRKSFGDKFDYKMVKRKIRKFDHITVKGK